MMREGKNMQAEGFETRKEMIQFIFSHFQTILLVWNEAVAVKHEGLAVSLPKAGLRLWSEAQLLMFSTLIYLSREPRPH